MRTRQEIEEKIKLLRKKPVHHVTDYDLGQISTLLWIVEDWDWEALKPNPEVEKARIMYKGAI